MSGKEKWPKVAIIVLNWNNYADTKECLESLENATYPNYEIIVVDNGSTDGSAARLEAEFPRHKFIRNKENLGFAGGCNVGIKVSLEENADCVLLLNNDAVLEPSSLKPAVETLFSSKEVGIVGGKIKNYFKRDRIDSVGVKRILWPIGFMRSEGMGRLDRGQFEARAERAAVSGALMLIKRDVFNAVGLLPECFFFGGEDIDFCLSAKEKGFKIIYEPCFVAYHKVGRSYSELTPGWIYNNLLSRQLVMKRHLRPFWWKINNFCFRLYTRYWSMPRYKRRILQRKTNYASTSKLLREIECAVEAGLRDGRVKDRIALGDLKRIYLDFTDREM